MFRLLSLILRNVLRNRRRTLLTLASTTISLTILTLMFVMYQGFFYHEDTSPSEALRMICRHKVSLTQPLPSSYLQRIAAVEGVEQVSAWSWFQGKYKEPKNFFARFAVDADKVFLIHKDWQVPPEQLVAFIRSRTACAVGQKIADKYNLKLGDRMIIEGDIYPVNLELEVAAIYQHPVNGECLLFHREYLSELLGAGAANKDMVGTFLILAKTPESVPGIARAIDTMFENSPHPTRTESEKEFGRSFLAFLGNIRVFMAAICSAVTFTIMLVSANTVAMAVRERTREMAILRTLGFRPGEILQLVLGEAMVISLIGGVAGMAAGGVLTQVINFASGFNFQGLKWQAALAVLVIAASVGLVSALFPAIFASRKNIVESLRFTG